MEHSFNFSLAMTSLSDVAQEELMALESIFGVNVHSPITVRTIFNTKVQIGLKLE